MMLQLDLLLQEQEWRRAREQRLRLLEHRQALRSAGREQRAPSALRRRLGGSLVQLGHRVAGEGHGSPVLTG
jgi:hypothetical protein